MLTRTRTAMTIGVLVTALVALGAGFTKERVTPAEWATGVCTAVGDWQQTAQSGSAALKASLSTGNPSLRDVRRELAAYLDDMSHATAKAVKGIKAAGVPSTAKGAKISDGMADLFVSIRDSMAKLHRQAQNISVKDRLKARKQIRALETKVDSEFEEFGTGFDKLKRYDTKRTLDKAFDASPACQAVSG